MGWTGVVGWCYITDQLIIMFWCAPGQNWCTIMVHVWISLQAAWWYFSSLTLNLSKVTLDCSLFTLFVRFQVILTKYMIKCHLKPACTKTKTHEEINKSVFIFAVRKADGQCWYAWNPKGVRLFTSGKKGLSKRKEKTLLWQPSFDSLSNILCLTAHITLLFPFLSVIGIRPAVKS